MGMPSSRLEALGGSDPVGKSQPVFVCVRISVDNEAVRPASVALEGPGGIGVAARLEPSWRHVALARAQTSLRRQWNGGGGVVTGGDAIPVAQSLQMNGVPHLFAIGMTNHREPTAGGHRLGQNGRATEHPINAGHQSAAVDLVPVQNHLCTRGIRDQCEGGFSVQVALMFDANRRVWKGFHLGSQECFGAMGHLRLSTGLGG